MRISLLPELKSFPYLIVPKNDFSGSSENPFFKVLVPDEAMVRMRSMMAFPLVDNLPYGSLGANRLTEDDWYDLPEEAWNRIECKGFSEDLQQILQVLFWSPIKEVASFLCRVALVHNIREADEAVFDWKTEQEDFDPAVFMQQLTFGHFPAQLRPVMFIGPSSWSNALPKYYEELDQQLWDTYFVPFLHQNGGKIIYATSLRVFTYRGKHRRYPLCWVPEDDAEEFRDTLDLVFSWYQDDPDKFAPVYSAGYLHQVIRDGKEIRCAGLNDI